MAGAGAARHGSNRLRLSRPAFLALWPAAKFSVFPNGGGLRGAGHGTAEATEGDGVGVFGGFHCCTFRLNGDGIGIGANAATYSSQTNFSVARSKDDRQTNPSRCVT